MGDVYGRSWKMATYSEDKEFYIMNFVKSMYGTVDRRLVKRAYTNLAPEENTMNPNSPQATNEALSINLEI